MTFLQLTKKSWPSCAKTVHPLKRVAVTIGLLILSGNKKSISSKVGNLALCPTHHARCNAKGLFCAGHILSNLLQLMYLRILDRYGTPIARGGAETIRHGHSLNRKLRSAHCLRTAIDSDLYAKNLCAPTLGKLTE
jgi:hypothetical protein